MQFQVRGFRAESCAVHLGMFAGALEGRNFPLLLGCSGCVAAFWALLRLGTAEPWCCSGGELWFPARALSLVWSEKGAREPLELTSKGFNPLMINDPCLSFCYLIYCQKHLWAQRRCARSGCSSCVKHSKVFWDAPGGFVKVLFADHYRHIIFNEIEKAQ